MKNLIFCLLLTGICFSAFGNTEREHLSETSAIDTTFISSVFCEGSTGCVFNGNLYGPGIDTIIFAGSGGMDSVIILECLLLPTDETVLLLEACEGDVISYDGQILPVPSVTTFLFTNVWGCDSIVIVEALAIPTPEVIPVNIMADQCRNCNGAISTAVSNPGNALIFEWSHGAVTQDVSGLCAGTYTVTVSDVNFGCFSTATVTVPLDDTSGTFEAIFDNIFDAACAGECTYGLDLNMYCGTAPYTFDWNINAYDGQEDLNDLCEGNYSVTVTDAEGLTSVSTIEFIDPPALTATATVTNISCSGGTDGSITLTVSGGIAPYSFLWANGVSGSNTITGLAAGSYETTIIDANGCTLAITTEILEPAPIELSIQTANVSCDGDGNATVTAMGGTGNYIYIWSTGETTPGILGLISGTYTVSVQDDNGCVAFDSIFIEPPFQIEVSSTFADCDSIGGTASVVVDGSIANPVYAWSNGETQSSITNVAPGWYSVTVADPVNNCQTHKNIFVPLDTACFVRISGYVYDDDFEQDCMIDAASQGVAGVLVELSNGDRTFTDQTGYYEFNVLPGTFDIDMILNSPAFEALCGATLSVNAPNFGGTFTDNNFYLKSTGIKDLRLKVSKRNARPGFTQWVNICVMNRGTVPMDGTLTFVHDPIQEYLSATRPFSNYDQTTQTMTWDFTNHPVGATIVYRVDFQIPVGTPLGEPLSMYFKVDPINGDLVPDDNEIYCDMLVTGSYDPNDKQVEPEGIGEEGGISMQDSLLTYHIRFQNTGTDTAFTVVIRDTLDQNLDPSSVVPGPASHPYELTFLKGNILEFTFNNIMLPDSFVNEPASNGFVFFDVKWKRGLEYGDMMKNTAAIYFDFNEPIITNTVTNTLRRPVGVFEPNALAIQLKARPNPTMGIFELTFELDQAMDLRMTLHDGQGKLLEEITTLRSYKSGKHQRQIQLNEYPQGVYLLHLQTDEGQSSSIRVLKIE